jgi:hypothetical protein
MKRVANIDLRCRLQRVTEMFCVISDVLFCTLLICWQCVFDQQLVN